MRQCSLGVVCYWGERGVPKQTCPACVKAALAKCKAAEEVERAWRAEKERGIVEHLEKRRAAEHRRAMRAALVKERDRLLRAIDKKRAEVKRRRAARDAAAADLAEAKLRIPPKRDAALRRLAAETAAAAATATPTSPGKDTSPERAATYLQFLRRQRLEDIREVFPLKPCDHTNHKGIVVCEGLCVPVHVDVDTVQAFSETKLSAAVGVLCHTLSLVSAVMGLPMHYELREAGSLTTICISSSSDSEKGPSSLWHQLVGAVSNAVGPNSPAAWTVDARQTLPLYLESCSDAKARAAFFKALSILNLSMAGMLRSLRVNVVSQTIAGITLSSPAEPDRSPVGPLGNVGGSMALTGDGLDTIQAVTLFHDCVASCLDASRLHRPPPVGREAYSAIPAHLGGTLKVGGVVVYCLRLNIAYSGGCGGGALEGVARIADPDSLAAGGKEAASAISADKLRGRFAPPNRVSVNFRLPMQISRLAAAGFRVPQLRGYSRTAHLMFRISLEGALADDTGCEPCVVGRWSISLDAQVASRSGSSAEGGERVLSEEDEVEVGEGEEEEGSVLPCSGAAEFVLRAMPGSYSAVVPGAYIRNLGRHASEPLPSPPTTPTTTARAKVHIPEALAMPHADHFANDASREELPRSASDTEDWTVVEF